MRYGGICAVAPVVCALVCVAHVVAVAIADPPHGTVTQAERRRRGRAHITIPSIEAAALDVAMERSIAHTIAEPRIWAPFHRRMFETRTGERQKTSDERNKEERS